MDDEIIYSWCFSSVECFDSTPSAAIIVLVDKLESLWSLRSQQGGERRQEPMRGGKREGQKGVRERYKEGGREGERGGDRYIERERDGEGERREGEREREREGQGREKEGREI